MTLTEVILLSVADALLAGIAAILLIFIFRNSALPGKPAPTPDPVIRIEDDGIVDTESEYEKQEAWKKDWLAEHYNTHPESESEAQHRVWEAQKAYMRSKR